MSYADALRARLDAETHAQCRADLASANETADGLAEAFRRQGDELATAREQLHRLRNALQAVIAHAATCEDCCGSLAAMGERIAREVGRD